MTAVVKSMADWLDFGAATCEACNTRNHLTDAVVSPRQCSPCLQLAVQRMRRVRVQSTVLVATWTLGRFAWLGTLGEPEPHLYVQLQSLVLDDHGGLGGHCVVQKARPGSAGAQVACVVHWRERAHELCYQALSDALLDLVLVVLREVER